MSRVLLFDGQQRNVLSCVRALGRSGHEVVVASHRKDALCFHSHYTKERWLCPDPKTEPRKFIADLLDHLVSTHYDLVLPFIDASTQLICRYQDEITSLAPILVPNLESFMVGFDKSETFRLAQKLEIPCPVTEFPESTERAFQMAEHMPYPLIIKPRISSGSRGLRVANGFDEFRRLYPLIDRDYPRPILQEFIPLGEAVGFVALYGRDGELKACCQHKRLHEYPLSGGPSTLRETINDDRLTRIGRKLLEHLSWRGPAMVEFRVDARDGIPKLMEINPRLWGSIALHIAAGVNFPGLMLKEALGEPYERVCSYREGTKAKWFFPGEILYFLANLRKGRLKFDALKWWGDDLVLDIESIDDPIPALIMVKNSVKSLFNIQSLKHTIFR